MTFNTTEIKAKAMATVICHRLTAACAILLFKNIPAASPMIRPATRVTTETTADIASSYDRCPVTYPRSSCGDP
ncbi:MAG: hypothetical protein P1Q69_17530, partial [Candidatus Thorarchaeota archaeon]|nr:hypothetical protein [Candidatus Thorarchaeota archaeon]